MSQKYRPDIDGLRGISVLAVVAFHAFPNWVIGGFTGVDAFFVISGYLISTIIFENLDKGTFSFYEFYGRRTIRILPALIIILVACFIIGWFSLLNKEYKKLGQHIFAGAYFMSNIILSGEAGYFDSAAETKPLTHLWSLAIEEQFYIFWPPLLWLSWRAKFNLLNVTLVIAIASFALNIKGVTQDAVATFYSPQTRFWELLSGSLLAWLTLHKSASPPSTKSKIHAMLLRIIYIEGQEAVDTRLANALSCSGLILLIFGFFAISKELSFPGIWALLPVLGAVLIIAAGSKAWVNRTILSNTIAVWFGLISFPLYLWHWPLLSFARIIGGEEPSYNIRIAVVALSIVLAWITYKFVEHPLRLGNHKKFYIAVLVALMTIVGYAGFITHERDGLKFRMINIINYDVTQALNYDWGRGYRYNICFINPSDVNTSTFSPFCSQDSGKKNKKLLIWGDSYSASLYRGFETVGKSLDFSVHQFSASGCPPILDFHVNNSKECINSNKYVFNEIKKLKPDILVLAANWELYDSNQQNNWENLDLDKFNATIEKIKRLGVHNITIVGQLPVYTLNQANMLIKRSPWASVDTITYKNFKPTAKIADEKMKNFASKLEVNFISPIELLCTSAGCLISIPGANIRPLSWDKGHLTTTGSEFLVSKFFDSGLIKFLN